MPRILPTDQTIQIGNRIQAERIRLGWTREQLAEAVDLTPGYIADLERGRTGLSVPRLIDFCSIFSCSADYILFGRHMADTRLASLPQPYQDRMDDILARQISLLHEVLQDKSAQK